MENSAGDFKDEHNEWIKRGFDEGAIVMVGTVHPGIGGAVFVRGNSMEEAQALVNQDPFVRERVVEAEILEIEPKKAIDELAWFTEG